MNWYIEVLKKYTVFTGRAPRTEYWMFTLVSALIAIGLSILELRMVIGLYAVAVFLPTIGVSIRRLHDTGRSGWWLLIGVIPFFGTIVLIVFAAQDSHTETNQYGPNPKNTTDIFTEELTGNLNKNVSEGKIEKTPVEEIKKDEVVINDIPVLDKTIVESHEALEEKN